MENATPTPEVETLAYSIDGFCEATATSRSAAYNEIRAGRLRAVKFGRRTLILRTDAEAWLACLGSEREARA